MKIFATTMAALTLAASSLGLVGCGGRSSPPDSTAETPHQVIDVVSDPGLLRAIENKYRPKFRWWWPTDQVDVQELHAELDAMHDAGFGGVEISLLRNPTEYGSATFKEKIRAVITRANELGMTVDMTLGASWPVSSPAVNDVTKGYSSRDIVYGFADVLGPLPYIGLVPAPIDSGLLDQRLVAVTAARLDYSLNPGIPITIPDDLNFLPVAIFPDLPPNPIPVLLDPSSMVDLTQSVDANGLLNWTPPAVGRWRVFAFWSRATAQRVHGDLFSLAGAVVQSNLPIDLGAITGLGSVTGDLVVDHFGKDAMNVVLQDLDEKVFGGDMAALFRANGGFIFEDSYELSHNQLGSVALTDKCICYALFWTPQFLEEFKKRRGYDLTPYLPAIYSAYNFADGNGARVRQDYFETLSDLLIDNHLKPQGEWASARGLKSRVQPYHLLGVDITRASAAAQYADTESLSFGDNGAAIAPGSEESIAVIEAYRKTVSGTHLSGAKNVGLEAGANILGGYGMTPYDYKAIADRGFAAGVTTPIIHGFAYRLYQDVYGQHAVWPGWDAWGTVFAESWNQTFPQMKKWKTLSSYMARASTVLQQGEPTVDLTVLTDAVHATESTPIYQGLQPSGYSWDVIDDTSISGLPAVVNKRLLPQGPSYRALVLDHIDKISSNTARQLLAFAKAGLPVVVLGDFPSSGKSYRDAAGEDASVQDVSEQLSSLANVSRIDSVEDLADTLQSLGVSPSLRAGSATSLVYQRRRLDSGDAWFVYNNGSQKVDAPVEFSSVGRPALIDLWTGDSLKPAVYSSQQGYTALPIRLEPGEAMVLTFNRSASSDTRFASSNADETRFVDGKGVFRSFKGDPMRVQQTDGRQQTLTAPSLAPAIPLKGPWALTANTVSPAGDETIQISLDALADWRDIPQLKNSAGTGIYTINIDIPAEAISMGRGYALDVGELQGMTEVYVNGVRAPTPAISAPARDVTSLLRPGPNEIRIEVATNLINRMIAQLRSGDVRYVLFAPRSTQAYGLIGPVNLIPYVEATIPMQR